MSTLAKTNILSLSISERIQLVEDIWDTIDESPEKDSEINLHSLNETAPLRKKKNVLVVTSVAQNSKKLSKKTVQKLSNRF